MSEKRPRGSDDEEDQKRSGGHRRRAVRSLGMPDAEWRSREQRRLRFLSEQTKKPSGDTPVVAIEAGESQSSQQHSVEVVQAQGRKPWESLVIGSLGENLSNIERKNREIEQQRFIVKFHEENSPHQVDHNRRILNRLMQERAEMEDNEENNMSQDEREKNERISRRLESLRWVLENSKCEDERINVRAAIQGYKSGWIPYSHDFTLLYAGHIVDRCQSYESFSRDRTERLDRYFASHGPGWLWQEPPLAGSGIDALGMKGACLEREFATDKYRIGTYQVTLELSIQRDRVSKGIPLAYPYEIDDNNRTQTRGADASCQLGTLLDSGATFPIILESDLARLNVDFINYPAQGVMDINVVGGKKKIKFRFKLLG